MAHSEKEAKDADIFLGAKRHACEIAKKKTEFSDFPIFRFSDFPIFRFSDFFDFFGAIFRFFLEPKLITFK